MNDLKIWVSRAVRSKTIHTANIIAILGIIQANSDFLSTVLSPKGFGWLMMGIAIIMVILRSQTTSALRDK